MARRYKLFFTLSSVEHKILSARKYKVTRNKVLILAQISLVPFFLLINVKMPIIVGILTFIKTKNYAQLS